MNARQALMSERQFLSHRLVPEEDKFHDLFCLLAESKCNPINPCKNGATCQEAHDTYKCLCREGFGGYNCEGRGLNRKLTVFTHEQLGTEENYVHSDCS